MTLSQAFQAFLIEQQIRGNSSKTLDYYSNCITPFISFVSGQKNISSLSLEDLRSYFLSLQKRNITSNSVKTYIKGIKVFISWLYSEKYIPVNLSESFHLPKAQRKIIDVLTDNEISALFSYFDIKSFLGLRDYCICALMLDSGLRKNEVIALSVPDVHISEGYLLVNGKGNKQRIVPLGFRTQKYLLRYSVVRPAVKYSALFLTKNYTPITPAVLDRLFKKLKSDLLTPRIRAHLLRHTFATNYLQNGGNIYSLQLILGHTTLEMVKKYVHLTQGKTLVNFTNYSPLDNIPEKRKKPQSIKNYSFNLLYGPSDRT